MTGRASVNRSSCRIQLCWWAGRGLGQRVALGLVEGARLWGGPGRRIVLALPGSAGLAPGI
ncbi:hypothetical protein GPN2_21672 [Streptomyces murinus]